MAYGTAAHRPFLIPPRTVKREGDVEIIGNGRGVHIYSSPPQTNREKPRG